MQNFASTQRQSFAEFVAVSSVLDIKQWTFEADVTVASGVMARADSAWQLRLAVCYIEVKRLHFEVTRPQNA